MTEIIVVPRSSLYNMTPTDWFPDDHSIYSTGLHPFNNHSDNAMVGFRRVDAKDEEYYDEAWIGHHVSWVNIAIIIAILIVLLAVGRY